MEIDHPVSFLLGDAVYLSQRTRLSKRFSCNSLMALQPMESNDKMILRVLNMLCRKTIKGDYRFYLGFFVGSFVFYEGFWEYFILNPLLNQSSEDVLLCKSLKRNYKETINSIQVFIHTAEDQFNWSLPEAFMAHILYIAQFYSSAEQPGGQGFRHFKHTQALAENGHQVTLITSGNTTMSNNHREQDVVPSHPDVTIVHLKSKPLNKRNVISRAINYFQFGFNALAAGIQLTLTEKPRYEIVLGSSPSIVIGVIAFILAFLNQAKFYLEVRDLWSQVMAANGFIRNKMVIALNAWVETFLYHHADTIIVLSQAFEEEIRKQAPGTKADFFFIPNGADFEIAAPAQSRVTSAPVKSKPFEVVFAGVFSDYTKLETLIETAKILQAKEEIVFHLVGGGYEYEKIKALAEEAGLENVNFWPAISKSEVSHFLARCDLSVISYRDLEIYKTVLPNKLFEYMTIARPIVASVCPGEITKVIESSECGIVVPPESPEQLAQSIVWLYEHPAERHKMGKNAVRYVRKHFDRSRLVQQYVDIFPMTEEQSMPMQMAIWNDEMETIKLSPVVVASGSENRQTA